ncbi:MAG TPA: hypothetical protein VHY08_18670 [Bacillota bacterium]|nr:hypothetical protein [Bacillota bacterium]
MYYEFDSLLPEGYEEHNQKLGEKPTVHPTAMIKKSRLGSWTDIGPRVSILESDVGDYTVVHLKPVIGTR